MDDRTALQKSRMRRRAPRDQPNAAKRGLTAIV